MTDLTEIFAWPQIGVFLIDMAIAVTIGIVIGQERHAAGKIMGKRSTIILIVGAFLFTYASQRVGLDHGRVVAQIVTGVGFIGAGIIFKRGDKDILNLTTAILVWTMAAIGVLIGLNLLIEAVVASAVIYVTLRTKDVIRRNEKDNKEDNV